jgi:small acid-soluble spore protein F (minor alpha/beta-type SASP)
VKNPDFLHEDFCLRQKLEGYKERYGYFMSRRQNVIPESVKEEISKELGVYNKVKANGWGDVSSKDCGNIVKKALEMSERFEDKK